MKKFKKTHLLIGLAMALYISFHVYLLAFHVYLWHKMTNLVHGIGIELRSDNWGYQQFITQESALMNNITKLIHDPQVGQIFHDKWGKAIEDEVQKVADSYHAGKFDASQTYKAKKMLQDPQMIGFMQQALEREKIKEDLASKWKGFSDAYKKTHNLSDIFALDGEDEYGTPKFKTPKEEATGEYTYDDYLKEIQKHNLKTDRGEVTRKRAGQTWDHFFGHSISQEQQEDLINNLVYRDNPQAFLALYKIMHTDLDKLRELVKEHPEIAQQYQQLKAWYLVAKTKALTALKRDYVDLQEYHPKVSSTNLSVSTGSGVNDQYGLSRRALVSEYMKAHEGQLIDCAAVRDLLADTTKGIKQIQGKNGYYKDGFFYNLFGDRFHSRTVGGSDITGTYVAANDPAHIEFVNPGLYKGNVGKAIGQELMNLFTKSGGYYNENGMTVHKGKLKTTGIINENILNNGIGGMYSNLRKDGLLPEGVKSEGDLKNYIMDKYIAYHPSSQTKYSFKDSNGKTAYAMAGFYTIPINHNILENAGMSTFLKNTDRHNRECLSKKECVKVFAKQTPICASISIPCLSLVSLDIWDIVGSDMYGFNRVAGWLIRSVDKVLETLTGLLANAIDWVHGYGFTTGEDNFAYKTYRTLEKIDELTLKPLNKDEIFFRVQGKVSDAQKLLYEFKLDKDPKTITVSEQKKLKALESKLSQEDKEILGEVRNMTPIEQETLKILDKNHNPYDILRSLERNANEGLQLAAETLLAAGISPMYFGLRNYNRQLQWNIMLWDHLSQKENYEELMSMPKDSEKRKLTEEFLIKPNFVTYSLASSVGFVSALTMGQVDFHPATYFFSFR